MKNHWSENDVIVSKMSQISQMSNGET